VPSDAARLYALAIGCGLVAEIGLAVAIRGGAPSWLTLLFFVEAVVLGYVFGARPGMAGAVAPFPVMVVIDWAWGNDVAGLVAPVVFVCLLQAFLAGMTGAMKARYGRGSGVD
jgi:hypothetical protein